MRGPRFFRKWYAETFGYFWLPCPRCGRMFGGHEEFGEALYNNEDPMIGSITCRRHKNPDGIEHIPLTKSVESSTSSAISPPPEAVAIIGEVTCTSPTPFQLVITRAGQQIYRSPWSTDGKVAIDRFPVEPGDSYHLEFKDQ